MWGIGEWVIVGVVMLLLLGGLIALAFVVLRTLAGTGSRQSPHSAVQSESALDILKSRYARGEIGKAEFEEMFRDLHD